MHDDAAAPGEPPYPYQELLGFEITDWSEGFARVELPVDARHANRYGIPHGGVHAALLDTAAGYAGCWTGRADEVRHAMTLSLTVNYVGRLTGTRMIAEARVTGGGKRAYFAALTLSDDAGALLATGSAVMRYRGG